MLSYQHGHHAGGWADIHKHAGLMLVLAAVRGRRHGRIRVIDTHAGRGVYVLAEGEAAAVAGKRRAEWHDGIGRLTTTSADHPGLADLLAAVAAANPTGEPLRYPGTTALALHRLGPADTVLAAERHPTEHAALVAAVGDDPRLRVRRQDGLALAGSALGGVTPTVLMVDPSYEVKADYLALGRWLAARLPSAPRTTALVWYPVLAAGRHQDLRGALAQTGLVIWESVLDRPAGAAAGGLAGSGLLWLNPPSGSSTVRPDWESLAPAVATALAAAPPAAEDPVAVSRPRASRSRNRPSPAGAAGAGAPRSGSSAPAARSRRGRR